MTMKHDNKKYIAMLGNNDEHLVHNPANNQHFDAILQATVHRRLVLKGGLGAMVATLFAPLTLTGCNDDDDSITHTAKPNETTAGNNDMGLLGFKAVPISTADTAVVPEGYATQVIAEWGRSISTPDLRYDLPFNNAEQQLDAIGSHHDGMHFFPIEGNSPDHGSSKEGLLVINHEYIEPRYMHHSAVGQALSRDDFPIYQQDAQNLRRSEDVLTELYGHGVSVIKIQQQADGQWQVSADKLNRRITGLTVMEISGPVRGSDWVKTKYSPDGTKTRGTLNNCSHGVTPWNTYLTCEENWAGYFRNRAQKTDDQPREHQRYGVTYDVSRYGWELADTPGEQEAYARFNAAPTGPDATSDYRNEPNCFGWVVEFDPFDPNSVPVKHSQLGRFAHEGVIFHPAIEGQPLVCYSGDDAMNEYIYKFISAEPYYKATASGHLLDQGTLYVAKFNADGSGEWLPLVWGQGPLQPTLDTNETADCPCFKDQADVLVNTRLAADRVGATKMDRPEWGAIDPKTGRVYFTLTNNASRGSDNSPIDTANPRPNNRWGHIIRWTEASNDPKATQFNWDIFILAGPQDDSDFANKSLDEQQIFNSPDGLWFDPEGRLWIQTDTSESLMNRGDYAQFGNNQMLACDTQHQILRRFFTGPIGQEITGVTATPDQKNMFINVQHPGATLSTDDFASGNLAGKGNWPLGGNNYARSATVVITKNDGGVIGS